MVNEETAQKTEYTVPTEIVDLPSKGLLYPEGHPLANGTIELKYMTAKEEDILMTESYIKQGVVLDNLFRALIVTKFNYNDLLICDKNMIMISARIMGYGKDYEFETTTPAGEKQKDTIDLTTLQIDDIDETKVTQGINSFEYTFPASKRKLTFKLLTHGDNVAIDAEIKALKKIKTIGGSSSGQLTTRLIHMITSIDGKEDKAYIRNFVNKELLAIDSIQFRNHVSTIQPDLDLKITLVDNLSGDPFDISLPIDVNFFWPSA